MQRRRKFRSNKRGKLAFVLGGGGARGALQIGALRALLEAGIQPDMLVGTSAGAINAVYLATHGLTPQGLDSLAEAWCEAAAAELMPPHYLWLTIRALFNRPSSQIEHRFRDFFVAHGLDPELRFGQLAGPRLVLVSADLKAACPVLYGTDPEQFVLEGLLASTALPPWIRPIDRDGHLLIDGGAVSNLPIEPALAQGATRIVALDLFDPRPMELEGDGFGPFLGRLLVTVEGRQIELELALARARGVDIHYLALQPEQPVQIWDFGHTEALIDEGYRIARRELAAWPTKRLLGPRARWFRLRRRRRQGA
ncbi:MAG: patatin-like phospholipase family protein [Anaerolineae bacterium]|nr:patatin-like phospholipase family protein [Anaerolineae bacterium]